MDGETSLIPVERIERAIILVRGEKVMLDRDLAEIYGVETKALNQAVKRNASRFPPDFMFQLTKGELPDLKSQIVTSSWGGLRKLPYAFTEHGALMLANVLNSERAAQTSVQVVRAFVRLRQWLTSNAELARKLEALEKCTQRNPIPSINAGKEAATTSLLAERSCRTALVLAAEHRRPSRLRPALTDSTADHAKYAKMADPAGSRFSRFSRSFLPPQSGFFYCRIGLLLWHHRRQP